MKKTKKRNDDTPHRIAYNLRRLRLAAGIKTGAELARRAGLSSHHVVMMERVGLYRKGPRIETLLKVCPVLKTSLEELTRPIPAARTKGEPRAEATRPNRSRRASRAARATRRHASRRRALAG